MVMHDSSYNVSICCKSTLATRVRNVYLYPCLVLEVHFYVFMRDLDKLMICHKL